MQIFYCDYCGEVIPGYNAHLNTRDKQDICSNCKTEYYRELNAITAVRDSEFETARVKYNEQTGKFNLKWNNKLEVQRRKR